MVAVKALCNEAQFMFENNFAPGENQTQFPVI